MLKEPGRKIKNDSEGCCEGKGPCLVREERGAVDRVECEGPHSTGSRKTSVNSEGSRQNVVIYWMKSSVKKISKSFP